MAGNGGEHFVNTETVSRVGFGDRTIPDVHLTRFAAYFVALNADQSKPEVRAQVRLVRHYGPYAPEFSDTAQERARSRPRGGPRRCGRRPEAVREALHPSGEVLGSAGDTPGGRPGRAGGTAGTRRGTGGGHAGGHAGTRRIHGAFPGTLRTCRGPSVHIRTPRVRRYGSNRRALDAQIAPNLLPGITTRSGTVHTPSTVECG